MQNKYKDITLKLITVFLYLQPFLDVIAGVLLHFNITNFVSNTIRLLFLIYMVIYLIVSKYKDKRKVLIYLSLLAVYLCLSSIHIINLLGANMLFSELKSTINAFYFVIMLIAFYELYKNNQIDRVHIRNVLFIYLLLVFIPNIFHIGFNSYQFDRLGFSGWFYSANTLGTIILLLTVYTLDKIKDLKLFEKVIMVLIYIYVIFSLGTKTPVAGIVLLVIVNALYYLIKSYKNKKVFYSIIVAIVVCGFMGVILLPKTSIYKNLEIYYEYLEKENISIDSLDFWDHIVLGHRIKCEEDLRSAYNESDINSKLFGIRYNSEPIKSAEMDYFDIFYREGIVGFILYMIPLVLIVIIYIKSLRLDFIGINRFLLLILILGLALVEGHVFTSVNVSIFASLMLGVVNYEKNCE